jgi:hypothetical protein
MEPFSRPTVDKVEINSAKEATGGMTPDPIGSQSIDQNNDREEAGGAKRRTQGDLAALARELVDKVGIEGAMRYCHSLGWGGVLHQVEMLRSPRS